MADDVVAEVLFVDGVKRQVHEDRDGRQYVLDDYGHKVYGVWIRHSSEDVQPDVCTIAPGD